MRLPDKNDPGGDKESELPCNIVLQTLRDNGVSIHHLGSELYLLSQGDEVTSQVFGELIGGLMIRRLSKKFAIHIVEFYYDPITGTRRSAN